MNMSAALRRPRFRLLALAALTVAAAVLSVYAAAPGRSATSPLSLTPTADAYVDSSNATTNFGTATVLQQMSPGTSTKVTYLKFVVSGLPGAPTSATLNLTSEVTGQTASKVFAVSDTSWTEQTITWNNRPAPGSTSIGSTGALTSGQMTSAVLANNAITGDGTYSFAVTNGATAVRTFDSKEQGPKAPTLVLNFSTPTSSPPTTTTGGTPTTTPPTTTPPTTTPPTTTPPTTTPPTTTPPTTTSPPSSDPVIMLGGDIACAPNDPNFNNLNGQPGKCHMKVTQGIERTLNPTAVLALGDEQYNSGNSSDFLASYDKTWGAFKQNTFPTVGNHEYGTSNAGGYFGYFGGAAHGPNGYYSFDIGAWHLVSINTECTRINSAAGCAAGSPQDTWLQADLAAHNNACTLVFGHRPRWSSNSFASSDIAPLMTDMYNAHVDIYAAGHSHSYERFSAQNPSGGSEPTRGVTQLVVGTGGSFFTGFGTVVANSQRHQSNIFGVLALTLHPNSWDYRFMADSSTPFTDSGSGTCH
jgi:hypothetical protein